MKGRTQLTALDVRVMDFNGCNAFFFEGRLDVRNMEKNLNEIAREVPDISGRVIKEGGVHYILNNNAGFKFLVEDDDKSIGSVNRCCLYRYGEPLAGKIVNKNEPIFNVKITRFRDGDLLCINHSHAICDGVGLFGLLVRWARLCRGGSPLPAMKLDRKPLLALEEGGFDVDSSEATLHEGSGIGSKYVHKKFKVVFAEFGRLKEKLLGGGGSGPWVSTRDLVVAKLLKELSFVKDVGGEMCVKSVMNFRGNREVGVDDHYFGNAISSAKAVYKISDLRRDDLLSVARSHRASVDGGRSLAAIKEAVNYKEGVGRLADTMLFVDDLSRFPLHEMDFGSGLPYLYEVAPPEGGDQIDPAKWFGNSIVNSIFMLPENPGNKNYLPVLIRLTEHEMESFLNVNSKKGFIV